MNDMRYLYGMTKSAAAAQSECRESIAGYFRAVRSGELLAKQAAEQAEKEQILRGILEKHAGCCRRAKASKQAVCRKKAVCGPNC